MLEWLPKNISTYGADLDGLFRLVYYITGVWFVVGEGALLWFLFRYRRRVSGSLRNERILA